MSAPDTFVPLSVRRGLVSHEEWEQGQQDMLDSPTEDESVKVELRKITQARQPAQEPTTPPLIVQHYPQEDT